MTIGNIGGTSIGSPTAGGGGCASGNAAANCTGGAAGVFGGFTVPAITICPVVNSGNASANGGSITTGAAPEGNGNDNADKKKKKKKKKKCKKRHKKC